MTGVFNFEDGGGRVVTNGKANWPHLLRIKLQPGRVRDLLIAAASSQNFQGVEICVMGKLTRDPEEDKGNPIEIGE